MQKMSSQLCNTNEQFSLKTLSWNSITCDQQNAVIFYAIAASIIHPSAIDDDGQNMLKQLRESVLEYLRDPSSTCFNGLKLKYMKSFKCIGNINKEYLEKYLVPSAWKTLISEDPTITEFYQDL